MVGKARILHALLTALESIALWTSQNRLFGTNYLPVARDGLQAAELMATATHAGIVSKTFLGHRFPLYPDNQKHRHVQNRLASYLTERLAC